MKILKIKMIKRKMAKNQEIAFEKIDENKRNKCTINLNYNANVFVY